MFTFISLVLSVSQFIVVLSQDYVDECPELNGFYADAVQCDRYYECKGGQVCWIVFNFFMALAKCSLIVVVTITIFFSDGHF